MEIIMGTGVCNLGSLNLTSFINTDGTFDWDLFKYTIVWGVRFLDNINDISNAPLTEYKKSMVEKRRIGLGIMGLGSLHFMLGIKYGSKESLEFIRKLYKFKSEIEILTSARLGKKKGSFQLFDRKKYFSSYWWKNLDIDPEIKKEVENIGEMRNSHRSMNAPTGNCVRKNTKIRTNEGIKSIKNIFEENNIDLYKESKNKWYMPIKEMYVETLYGQKRITGLYINNNNEVISIKTKNGKKIEGTPDHKVLVKIDSKTAEWKKLKDLKINDKILIKNDSTN